MFIFWGEQRREEGGYKPSFSSNNMKQTTDFHVFQTKTCNFLQIWHMAFVNYCDSLNPGFWWDCSVTRRLKQYTVLIWKACSSHSALNQDCIHWTSSLSSKFKLPSWPAQIPLQAFNSHKTLPFKADVGDNFATFICANYVSGTSFPPHRLGIPAHLVKSQELCMNPSQADLIL